MKTTHFAIVLDSSGSIDSYGLRPHIKQLFDTQIGELKQHADQEFLVSLFVFGNHTDLVYHDRPSSQVQPLNTKTEYKPYNSGTALLDAIGTTLDRLSPAKYGADDAYFMLVLTDGEELHSTKYPSRIADMIRDAVKTGHWTIAIQMPHQMVERFARDYNISRDNILPWNEQGGAAEVQRTNVVTQSAVSNYAAARSAGKTATASFYKATTDLSKVSDADVVKKLTDVTAGHKIYQVPKQSRIDDFVTSKTKQPYVTGQAYYLLMKPEKVQDHKSVLLVKKNTKAPVYGGIEARRIIGLQDTGVGKILPGNHGDWDVFVQSKAPNRNLPLGTRLIIDCVKVKADNPTWTPPEEDAYSFV